MLGAQTIARYADIGYKSLGVRGKEVVSNSELKGATGFTSLQFRGIPIIKDAFCPKGTIYVINENYYKWRARTIVPTGFDKAGLEKISLGESKTTEGAMAKPSEYNGFFSQPLIWQSDKAALIGRLYAAGQFIVSQPRRHSKIINISFFANTFNSASSHVAASLIGPLRAVVVFAAGPSFGIGLHGAAPLPGRE